MPCFIEYNDFVMIKKFGFYYRDKVILLLLQNLKKHTTSRVTSRGSCLACPREVTLLAGPKKTCFAGVCAKTKWERSITFMAKTGTARLQGGR